jgi:NADH dehydrogenase [ubiquinone] 1 alpha subcomplex assembly factor 7
MLLRKEKDETVKKNLLSGYDMITNPEKMGERFKFFAMLQKKKDDSYIPEGFKPLPIK